MHIPFEFITVSNQFTVSNRINIHIVTIIQSSSKGKILFSKIGIKGINIPRYKHVSGTAILR